MSMDERISFLLRAAIRAEGEGESRVARNLRRMAEEVRPLDMGELGLPLNTRLGWGTE
jgi:hypothetical protein